MKIDMCDQGSDEWLKLKWGKIGGTRFGQLISSRDNVLKYEILKESISEWVPDFTDVWISEDMQYGIDSEPIARGILERIENIKIEQCGAILSDFCKLSMASPDGIHTIEGGKIVHEIKSTRNEATHIKRMFEGIDDKHLPQCLNYFCQSNEVKEVWYTSYCGFHANKKTVTIKLNRDSIIEVTKATVKNPSINITVQMKVDEAISKLKAFEAESENMITEYKNLIFKTN